MDKMTFDFAFIEHSLLHGEFLCEVYQSCPGIKIEDVKKQHEWKANTVFLSVSVPEDIATILKLRFGHCIVMRPPPKKKCNDIFDEYTMKKFKDVWVDYDTLYKKKSIRDDYDDYKKLYSKYLKEKVKQEELDTSKKYIIDSESWLDDIKW
jgi:hypothetical protein